MLKSRVIFALIYADGFFCQSRNFRLQRVGDLSWLFENYDFQNIARAIDELVVLDASRGERDFVKFSSVLSELREMVQIPIAAGGGVRDVSEASKLFAVGADKIVLNSMLFNDIAGVKLLHDKFGRQALIASMDFVVLGTTNKLMMYNGSTPYDGRVAQHLADVEPLVGEILWNSIERDGTGFGVDLDSLCSIGRLSKRPIIAMGGVGSGSHMLDALGVDNCDAVATANLFNFIGDGLLDARRFLLERSVKLARWEI